MQDFQQFASSMGVGFFKFHFGNKCICNGHENQNPFGDFLAHDNFCLKNV